MINEVLIFLVSLAICAANALKAAEQAELDRMAEGKVFKYSEEVMIDGKKELVMSTENFNKFKVLTDMMGSRRDYSGSGIEGKEIVYFPSTSNGLKDNRTMREWLEYTLFYAEQRRYLPIDAAVFWGITAFVDALHLIDQTDSDITLINNLMDLGFKAEDARGAIVAYSKKTELFDRASLATIKKLFALCIHGHPFNILKDEQIMNVYSHEDVSFYEWKEILENPYINYDGNSTFTEYYNSVVLKDRALNDMSTEDKEIALTLMGLLRFSSHCVSVNCGICYPLPDNITLPPSRYYLQNIGDFSKVVELVNTKGGLKGIVDLTNLIPVELYYNFDNIIEKIEYMSVEYKDLYENEERTLALLNLTKRATNLKKIDIKIDCFASTAISYEDSMNLPQKDLEINLVIEGHMLSEERVDELENLKITSKIKSITIEKSTRNFTVYLNQPIEMKKRFKALFVHWKVDWETDDVPKDLTVQGMKDMKLLEILSIDLKYDIYNKVLEFLIENIEIFRNIKCLILSNISKKKRRLIVALQKKVNKINLDENTERFSTKIYLEDNSNNSTESYALCEIYPENDMEAIDSDTDMILFE